MSGRTQNSDAVDVIFVRLPGTSSALCGPRSILCNSPIRSAQSVATVLAGRHRQNSIHNHLNDISIVVIRRHAQPVALVVTAR
jgi:hypothetical protein